MHPSGWALFPTHGYVIIQTQEHTYMCSMHAVGWYGRANAARDCDCITSYNNKNAHVATR